MEAEVPHQRSSESNVYGLHCSHSEHTLEIPEHLYPALKRMLDTLTKKKNDYSQSGPWANFNFTSKHFGFPNYEAADFNELQKLSRIRSLRDGRDVLNEPLEDTYLDKANFALLAYAMFLEEYQPNSPDPDAG